ncbi:MAG: T9SS type A sorting domain-containing protein [Bacteroidales bacterium]
MKYKILILALMVCFSNLLLSQTYNFKSKNDVIDFVKNEVVGARIDHVNLYMEPNVQTNNYYIISPYDSISSNYSEYWLFFIDEQPEYLWGHKCNYVFVNSTDGSFYAIEKQLPPLNFRMLEDVNISFNFNFGSSNIVSYPGNSVISPNINNGKYAVLFLGQDGGKPPMWNALSHTYTSLIENGYKKDNIYVLSYDGTASPATNFSLDLDGDSIPDIMDTVCNSQNLGLVFQHLSEVMTDSDILYVFATCHGEQSPNTDNVNFVLWENELLSDEDFASMIENINCSQMIFNIFTCYSGGFEGDILATNNSVRKTILTCTDSVNAYCRSLNFSNSTGFDEYTYLMCSALRGYHPVIGSPWLRAEPIGECSYYNALFPNSGGEINFDNISNGGNSNGIQEINEAILYTAKEDWQFEFRGCKTYYNGFKEDLLSLKGISGKITNTQSIKGPFHIEDSLSAEPNIILTMEDSTKFYLFDCDFTVKRNSNISIGNNVYFVAKSGTNKIIIDGIMSNLNNVSFIAEDDATLEVILNSINGIVSLSNCNFENCKFTNNTSALNITNCTFTNCDYVISKNSTTIENSNFLETSIDLNAGPSNIGKTAIVRNCIVTNNNREGVLVENFPTYTIEDNNIIGGLRAAICIYNSGFGNSKSVVSDNYLHDGAAGIEIYASSGDLLNNKISNNTAAGAKLLHISNVNILGDQRASGSCNNTQYFYNNTGPELYISGTSFPSQIRYNCFCHSNVNTPYVYYEDAQGSHLRDVRVNCWCGNVSNTPHYFYPTNIFEYNPVWCPTAVIPDPPSNPDRALYQSAENNEQNGNYSDAKTEYQSVVGLYPETDFAQASLKKLLNLEEFAGNDYASLQTYYNNLTDSSLLKLSDILANKCNERLGNWQAAIDWYENVINNPPSFEDSIFSVIDLGYAHLMMNQQGGSRAAYTCTLPEHKPESEVQFFKKRNYLLSLLPVKESLKAIEKELPLTKLGEITNIVPNPASSNANVSFMLNNSGNVKLNIMSSIGKIVKIIEFGEREKGVSQFGVDISELPSGMYLFKLTVDGNYCDTKKVIIAK